MDLKLFIYYLLYVFRMEKELEYYQIQSIFNKFYLKCLTSIQ